VIYPCKNHQHRDRTPPNYAQHPLDKSTRQTYTNNHSRTKTPSLR